MKIKLWNVIPISCFLLVGCRTVNQPSAQLKANQEAQGALTSVAGSLAGKDLSENDLKNLKRQLQHDPEAREAVETLTNTLSNQKTIVKYCPVDGERYSEKFETCPTHNTKLKIVGE